MKGSWFKLCYAFVILLLLHMNHSSLGFNTSGDDNNIRCIEKERRALIAFKRGVVDTENRLLSWETQAGDKDCCTWEGVYCSNLTGHVIKLDLGNQGLEGMISPKLVELHHLKLLNLSYNDFSQREISKFNISSLSNLRYLDLSEAGLGGKIPYHQLGNLTHLQYLDLSGNDFTSVGNLNWLHHLSSLEHLDLGWNDFTSVGNLNWLHQLSSLEHLDLSLVNLSNVFDWLKTVNKLPQLRILVLYNCSLPDPPILSSTLSDINSSKSLAKVDLGGNHITSSIFQWFFNYYNTSHSLVYIDLYDNLLGGSIPDISDNMSSLAHLDLSRNQLGGGIPHSFAKLCNLQWLDIGYNNFSGQFSEIVEILSSCAQNSLEVLILNTNQHIAGSLPNLTIFSSLKSLSLSNNRLSGRIPESIGEMSKLEELFLLNNSLEGVISETHFSNLSKLKALGLSKNPLLVLNFHPDWVPPFQLDYIILQSCKMGPHFPKWLRTQKNYSFLDISNAEISDILPNWFWGLSSEAFLVKLSNNQIRGTLDGSIASIISKVYSLDLSNNTISGSISFLCSTKSKNLLVLDLSRNKVSGVLPNCWIHMKDLIVLDLSYNALSGEIPPTMGSLYQISWLKLTGNRLVGELPSSMKNCTQLRVLDLGYNKLLGPLPKWLGLTGTQNLSILMLQSNHFNGSMPSQLCTLAHIQILDLSMNNISGIIPKCLNNLTALAQKGNSNPTDFVYASDGVVSINIFRADASFIWKGRMVTYTSTLRLVKKIDLSSNKLSGDIPSEIAHLVELVSLNLSRNQLTGQITSEIGKLHSLDNLDLSRNHLCGRIPTSLAKIYDIGFLDLSNNNLSGKIPIGPQLQTMDSADFEGNPQLCGLPLKRPCPSGETGPEQIVIVDEESKYGLVTQEFYFSMGLGFFVGFWGVFGTLLVNKSWRYKYFSFLNDVNDWVYVRTALIRRTRMFRS